MIKKWRIPLAVLLSLVLGFTGGMYWTSVVNKHDENQSGQSQPPEWGKLEQAYSLILNQYVEKVSSSQLVEGAIQGMVATLKDPYSAYMDKEMAEQFNETLDSSFEGIGTEIGVEQGKIIIVSPYKNSPAEKAGLKPKDEIVKVDGESVEGLGLYETRLKIRGEKGSKVRIAVKRAGVANPIEFTITRDEIPLETVHSSLKEEAGKKIGYLEVTSFSRDTAKEFKTKLKKLELAGMEGLLIDVRGNPGGLLPTVEEIVGEFITKDQPFMQVATRTGETQAFFTDQDKKKPYPIAVLTDNGSASASEILAGALKEAGGYPIIGETTFGKGTVQQAVPIGGGSNLKLTLFKWLTPEGNWIHQKGIEPTLRVKQPDYFNVQPLSIEKTLERDMNDEQVALAQEMLKGLGLETGRHDGYFDLKTEIAVKAFQKLHGLDATGKLDTLTADKLETSIVEKISDEENDIQLLAALKYIAR